MAMQVITGFQISNPNLLTPLVFDNSNFILQQIDGLESPLIRLPRYNLPGQSGAFISNQLYGERVIKVKGVINANGINNYLTNRSQFINTLAIATDNDGSVLPLTLQITLQNGEALTSNVYFAKELSLPFGVDMTDYGEFLLQFVAPDPNLYSTALTTVSISLPVGGGTAIPTPIPVSLSPTSGGQASVNNIGSNLAFPTITISAPIINPYITNLRTGQFMQINYILNAGDNPLIIDCKNQIITQGLNIVTGIQTLDSTFWSILPSTNTIAFSAASGTGNAVISFYPTFIGI